MSCSDTSTSQSVQPPKEIIQMAIIFGHAGSVFPRQDHPKKILAKEESCSDLVLPRSLNAVLTYVPVQPILLRRIL